MTHDDAPQLVGLLWTSDQLVTETSTWRHNRRTSMPPVGFEPTIPAGERPQTHALDDAHWDRESGVCVYVCNGK